MAKKKTNSSISVCLNGRRSINRNWSEIEKVIHEFVDRVPGARRDGYMEHGFEIIELMALEILIARRYAMLKG